MSEPKATASDPFSLEDGEDEEVTELDPAAVDGEGDGADSDDDDDDDGVASAASLDRLRIELEEQEAAEIARSRAAKAAPVRRIARDEPSPPPQPTATMLVRVKPFNAKKGQTMSTFSCIHAGERVKFVEGHGWYEVSHSLAERLREVRCSDMDPESNLAFDVCTPVQARKTDAREEQAKEQETRSPARRPRSATA